MKTFDFAPANWIPFRDKKELARVRAIKREDITKHPNPDLRISVYRDEEFELVMLTDMFRRILHSDQYDEKVVMIMPNPCTTYRKLAYMINQCNVDCRNVKFYMMDEWADEEGNIAPLSYKAGFGNAFMRFCVTQIDEKLRMPEENVVYFTNENVGHYSKLLEDEGEADIVYSGPGWPGHLAFIDPVEEWYCDTIDEYIRQSAKVAPLHPMTILQNSMHGSFGCSGDVANVPPKGAMIGPRDAMKAKNVLDMHGITVCDTRVSWQRMMSRLCVHGPVCQEIPASVLQLRKSGTEIVFSENAAATIEPYYYFQY
jgi:6-phosphogluconolactonase/glucosamine-6-phosphate isomerase/deaminase